MSQKTVVHFRVEADFITEHARNLWSEGEYQKAIDFLGTMNGISLNQIYDVIMGKSKFKEIDKSQIFTLAPDNWVPVVENCHLCQYPNPVNGKEMRAAEEKLKELEARKRFSRLLREAEESARVDYYKYSLFPTTRGAEKLFNTTQDDIDDFIAGEKFNSELEDSGKKPKPEIDVFPNGIITPDGAFYRCEFAGHAILAKALGYFGDDGAAPDEVAVKSGCMVLSANLAIRKKRSIEGMITDAQKETFRRWRIAGYYPETTYYETDI